jgi:hypothetical protein
VAQRILAASSSRAIWLDPSKVVLRRNALPLDGTKGGIPKDIVPNWMEDGSIPITGVSGINPRFCHDDKRCAISELS